MGIPEQTNQLSIESAEALLNEEKGNLFEFIVAQILSRINNIESKFFTELNANLKNNMACYEESIRQTHPELIPLLSQLANSTAQVLDAHLQQKDLKLKDIFLVGKITANFEKEEWHESDLILKTEEDRLIPISLKLSKENSYTNTKSAGAKSFIEKYFQSFSESKQMQSELNKEIDQSFLQMSHRLYQLASLPFLGKFDESWKDKWSELPGELPPEFREVIFVNYNRVASLIHKQLLHLLNTDKEKFISALAPLCGIGDPNLIQVSCYHQQHSLKSIEIKEFGDFFREGINISIEPLKNQMSSFDIVFGNMALQIRVKPMNKFTTASYKINCSIKTKRVRDE